MQNLKHFQALFFNWVNVVKPDIIGLQEVKADIEQVSEAFWQNDGENAYKEIWHSGVRKGYSGALLLSKQSTESSILGLDEAEFLNEGRVIEADFDAFTLLTAYFPNGGRNSERLDYKLRFYEAFLERIRKLRKDGKSVIFMGDLNVAHKAIDLARPEENIKNSGYLEVEREWMIRSKNALGQCHLVGHEGPGFGAFSAVDEGSREIQGSDNGMFVGVSQRHHKPREYVSPHAQGFFQSSSAMIRVRKIALQSEHVFF